MAHINSQISSLEELKRLCARLTKTGKSESVRVSLEALLLSPSELDLQINVLGAAHQEHWLPNRKKVLWQILPIHSEEWICRCVARVTQTPFDTKALCALLGTDAMPVAKAIQTHAPDLVMVWDVKEAQYCGIGLAHRLENSFDCYFYIGWQSNCKIVTRLDFAPRIHALPEQEVTDGIWAELPYGYGPLTRYLEFGNIGAHSKPYGYTQTMRHQLGYLSD